MSAPEIAKLPGLKEHQLSPCKVCGKPLTHDRSIAFYRVTVERYVLNPGAIQRQVGLGMMLGHAALAWAMGPDEDLAMRIGGHDPANICDTCAITGGPIAAIDERLSDAAESREAPA